MNKMLSNKCSDGVFLT